MNVTRDACPATPKPVFSMRSKFAWKLSMLFSPGYGFMEMSSNAPAGKFVPACNGHGFGVLMDSGINSEQPYYDLRDLSVGRPGVHLG